MDMQYMPKVSETAFTLLTKIIVAFSTIVSGIVLVLDIMLLITSFDNGFGLSSMLIILLLLVKCTTIFFLYYFLFTETTYVDVCKYVFITGEAVMGVTFCYLVYQIMAITGNFVSVITNPFVIDFGFLCFTTGFALIIAFTNKGMEQYFYYPGMMSRMEMVEESRKETKRNMIPYVFYPSY